MDAFVWSAADMPEVDPDFLCHHSTMDERVKPIVQKQRKFNEEKRRTIKNETQKLMEVGHVREIQYPKWLVNVVMVKKSNKNWRM